MLSNVHFRLQFTLVCQSSSHEPKTYPTIIGVDTFILLLEVCDSNCYLIFNDFDHLRNAMPASEFASVWFSPDSVTTGMIPYAPLDGRSEGSYCERCKQNTANSCKKKKSTISVRTQNPMFQIGVRYFYFIILLLYFAVIKVYINTKNGYEIRSARNASIVT